MMRLNSVVVSELRSFGLDVKSVTLRTNGLRVLVLIFLKNLPIHHGVTVVYGDVVDDDAKEFGILSGDDLMLRYSTEIAGVERAVFAIGGVDGILQCTTLKSRTR